MAPTRQIHSCNDGRNAFVAQFPGQGNAVHLCTWGLPDNQFASAPGSIGHDRTGQREDDPQLAWQAPVRAGTGDPA